MKLSYLFSDHMVLQQNKPLYFWGEGQGKVKINLCGENFYTVAKNGSWKAVLPPMKSGGPYELVISDHLSEVKLKDVMIGEVWLAAGQSNMEHTTFATEGGFEEAKNCENSNIRFFSVPRRPTENFKGYNWHFEGVEAKDTPWQLCNEKTALSFSAIGFYFSEILQRSKGTAVGIISCNYGGTMIETWIERERIFRNPKLKRLTDHCNSILMNLDLEEYERKRNSYAEYMSSESKRVNALEKAKELGVYKFARTNIINWPSEEPPEGPNWQNWPGVLYENMVKKITPYSIRGVLWYQGESNLLYPLEYADLFAELVNNWRSDWNDKLPFLTVQIAPFMYGTGEKYPLIVEQQIKAARENEGVVMVTSSDIGEKHNIHPIKKKCIAERLFAAAQYLVYNKDVEYSGPVYENATLENNKIIVRFSHAASGLVCNGAVSELSVAGEDGIYKKAEGKIRGSELIISSKDVEKPVEAKMGFTDYSEINLYNKEGFIAAPFRTGKICNDKIS